MGDMMSGFAGMDFGSTSAPPAPPGPAGEPKPSGSGGDDLLGLL